MLFTERKAASVAALAAGAADAIRYARSKQNGRRFSPPPACHARSALLGAVALRYLLVGRLLRRLLHDHRVEDREVGLVPAGDHLPFLAIPLLDAGLVTT